MAVKTYILNDDWKDLDKHNKLAAYSEDGEITGVWLNGEELGGGGGGGDSDFDYLTKISSNPVVDAIHQKMTINLTWRQAVNRSHTYYFIVTDNKGLDTIMENVPFIINMAYYDENEPGYFAWATVAKNVDEDEYNTAVMAEYSGDNPDSLIQFNL